VREGGLNFGLRMMAKNGAGVNFDEGLLLPCFLQGNFGFSLLPPV
jgi:hypothetical protein